MLFSSTPFQEIGATQPVWPGNFGLRTYPQVGNYRSEQPRTRRRSEVLAKKRVDSWVVTDEFWRRVEPLIPARRTPSADKQYVRKPGAGRPPKSARQVFEGIVYVLRTGCQWKALRGERFGSASAVHKRFLEWEQAGFLEAL